MTDGSELDSIVGGGDGTEENKWLGSADGTEENVGVGVMVGEGLLGTGSFRKQFIQGLSVDHVAFTVV